MIINSHSAKLILWYNFNNINSLAFATKSMLILFIPVCTCAAQVKRLVVSVYYMYIWVVHAFEGLREVQKHCACYITAVHSFLPQVTNIEDHIVVEWPGLKPDWSGERRPLCSAKWELSCMHCSNVSQIALSPPIPPLFSKRGVSFGSWCFKNDLCCARYVASFVFVLVVTSIS